MVNTEWCAWFEGTRTTFSCELKVSDSVGTSKDELNLTELAKKRYFEKWSVLRLAVHFQRSLETVQMHLCRMRKPGGLRKLSLSASELEALRPRFKEVFKGR